MVVPPIPTTSGGWVVSVIAASLISMRRSHGMWHGRYPSRAREERCHAALWTGVDGGIRARQEATTAVRRPDKRKPLPGFVLPNNYFRPWKAGGFGSRVNDAEAAAGIGKHLHDLRGTFAIRCMLAGPTDEQIADSIGWSSKDVATIRARYMDQTRLAIAIGERLAQGASA